MDVRAIIAVVLSIAALYISTKLFPAPPAPTSTPVQKQVSTVTSAAKETPRVTASKPVAPAATNEKEIVVETDLYTAVFSTKGAVIKKLVLKKYNETVKGGNVTLIADSAANGVVQTTADGFSIDPQALYSVNSKDAILGKGEKRDIQFVSVSQGVVTTKTYHIASDVYKIGLTYHVANTSPSPVTGTVKTIFPYHLLPADKISRFEATGAVTFVGGDFHNDKTPKIQKESKKYSGQVAWAGFADKYFLSAILEENGSLAAASYEKGTAPEYLYASVSSPSLKIGGGDTATLSYNLYFGPKDLDILKAQGHELERALDLGYFSAIAKPLLRVLKFFYGYVHNYGIAIIIITFIIKLLFVPLTHKSYVSMKEMQKIQPKMMELREKYKNDKDAMNRAMIELYRTHKVNPLGGCLPMLVQFPVFIALYNALMNSIEMRHAPFMLWIHDLSVKDPYYITPLIMGATMFLQQKMTPTSGMDPMQAKMMMLLPIVFTAMFLNFPSGLVLYWLINNILTIAQQYYINKVVKV